MVAGPVWFHPASDAALTWPAVAGLVLAPVVANVFDCAAYAADQFLQASDFQATWKRWRWMLWGLGMFLAAGSYLLHE